MLQTDYKELSNRPYQETESLFFSGNSKAAIEKLHTAQDADARSFTSSSEEYDQRRKFFHIHPDWMALCQDIPPQIEGVSTEDREKILRIFEWTTLNGLKPKNQLFEVLEGKQYTWKRWDKEATEKMKGPRNLEKRKAEYLLLYMCKLLYRARILHEVKQRNQGEYFLLITSPMPDTPRCKSRSFFAKDVSPDILPPHGILCRCSIDIIEEHSYSEEYKKRFGNPR